MIAAHFTPCPEPAARTRSRGRGRALRVACAGLMLAGAAAVTAGSCAEPEASFYVTEATVSTATPDPISGSFTVACGMSPGASAVVWVGLCNGVPDPTGQVVACFGVRSELVPAGTLARIESRSIILTEAEATLTPAGGSELSGTFAVTGILDPTMPGAVPPVTVIPIYFAKGTDYAALLNAGTAQGSIILHGRTTGNLDLQTPRFDFEAVISGVEHCKM